MARDKRFSKEAGTIICHCECGKNMACPVSPEDSPCVKARVKVSKRLAKNEGEFID